MKIAGALPCSVGCWLARLDRVRGWVVVLCLWLLLLLPGQSGAAQFVDLTVEIESIKPLVMDKKGEPSRSAWRVQCLVGTNLCRMNGEFVRIPMVEKIPEGLFKPIELPPAGTPPNIVEGDPRKYESLDGTPPMSGFPGMQISWLAFCSGSYLRKETRQIPLPARGFTPVSQYSETTKIFEDGLGLPKSVALSTTNNQPVLDYRVRQSTNVGGWNLPLAFDLTQFSPAQNGRWETYMMSTGRVTRITIAAEPQIPGKR